MGDQGADLVAPLSGFFKRDFGVGTERNTDALRRHENR